MSLRLSESLFWDTDFSKIDPDLQWKEIITRVFEYGTWSEVKEIIAYYGSEKVKNHLVSAAYLRENAVNLARSLFNLNPPDFKCYTEKQSRHNW